MSALSAKPEDAAPAALVSQSTCSPGHGSPSGQGACGVGVGGDGDGDGGGAPEASFPSPAVALASGQVPDQAAGPHEGQHRQPAPPTPVLPSLPVSPPQTPLNTVDPTGSHADQNSKKFPRGPISTQRPHGSSLLTQALASARGIPPQPELLHNQPSQTNLPNHDVQQTNIRLSCRGRDTTAHLNSGLNKCANHTTPTLGSNTSEPSDGDTLIHRVSLQSAVMASSAAATTISDLLPHASLKSPTCATSPSSYALLDVHDFQSANSTIESPRDFYSNTRAGTSHLERPAMEILAQGRHDSPRKPSFGNDPTYSPSRPRHMEQRVTIGPEKAWSIESGQLDHGQNGQVERSIAEVLAGVEPNARSRKASHSLRFFKEGLPDDNSQRREMRLPSHPREKLLSGMSSGDSIGETASSAVSDTQDGRAVLCSARACPFPIRASEECVVSEPPEDCVAGTRHRRENFDCLSKEAAYKHVSEPITKNDESRGSADPVSPQQPRGNGQSAPVLVEEAEESGEEKISSAVFLPHQGLVESPPLKHVDGLPSGSLTGNKAQSRPDDFHPWLVKANDPEADGNGMENIGLIEEGDRDRTRMLPPRTGTGQPDADDSVRPEAPDTATRSSRPASYHRDYVHEHQLVPKQPLEAIELIPYKHQVGGHTTLWRFSKRAVCKQLNNRENEFYETVEKFHRDLITFLPRYIGVLNVTFKKQPRRRSTAKRDEVAAAEIKQVDQVSRDQALPVAEAAVQGTFPDPTESLEPQNGHRVISQSLQSTRLPVPTVTFVDNQHILPRNLWRLPLKGASFPGRYNSAPVSLTSTEIQFSEHSTSTRVSRTRERQYTVLTQGSRNSWGATMVNKKLRNEVFNDAFLKQPGSIQRHRKGHQRTLPHRAMQALRPASSDSSLLMPPSSEVGMTDPAKKQDGTGNGSRPRETWNDTVKLQRPQSYSNKTYLSGITGTSVPEPNVSAGTLVAQERQRRYSGTALQRDAMDGRQSWGELQCYEEPDQAGFQGDCEEPMAPALETASANLASEEVGAIGVGQHHRDCLQDSDAPSATPLMVPNTTVELERLPRPSNPKEAQTQRDSRVEYFLLMEDLTAGMKRPCIMDLKMGTRQYGVDANSKKQRSQQGKCAKTTSRALGVRVCGLQVWDVESQSYVFKDKYYGRSIKAGQEFQEALTRFLYDGVDKGSILRHVPTVLQKLSELEVIIKRLRGYRFYASSLLMFYDGDTSEVEYDTALDDSTTDVGTDIEEGTRRSRKNKRDIDFKIADFANSVTAGDLAKDRPCPPAHPTEPDRGFLRGLRSLRRYFLRIQQDTRAELGVATYHRRDAQIENVGKDMDMDMDEDDDDDEDAEYVSE